MKLFNAEQIKAWDNYTIQHEPISSTQLMERAATHFILAAAKKLKRYKTIHIFCGSGNNGGDGLAIARLIGDNRVKVYHIATGNVASDDFKINLAKLSQSPKNINSDADFPKISDQELVIDAILGSGISRNTEGITASLIEHINQSKAKILAIDVPSGMFIDRQSTNVSVLAHTTYSFQTPKLAFLLPENAYRVGKMKIIDIGLHDDFTDSASSNYHFLMPKDIKKMIRKRHQFDHKGTFGHAQIIAGSYGKMGAAILASQACLRAGAGLLTIYIPKSAYDIMQISVPEAMVVVDNDIWQLTQVPYKYFDALGIGPGLGTSKETVNAFEKILQAQQQPIVIDADALNILAYYPDLQQFIPKNSILTPHPKEFERLFGKTENQFERLDLLRQKAVDLGVIIVLKGAHSAIAMPDGKIYFNSTGNPGMATAGSSDVLTGILTGLLAQGYSPREAALIGVFAHGKAGDLAAKQTSMKGLIAGDLVDFLPQTWLSLS